MDLKIRRIRYENIREFEELELDLTNGTDDPHHVSLVQMPNGTGKTTTMDLIRTILLGEDLDEEEVQSYEPNDFDALDGTFEVDFEFEGDVFTLRLELDYEYGNYSYRHIKPQRVAGGDIPEHRLPPELENVMTGSFVDLFVFNGELTEEFIKTGSEEAENAIKIVNYLNRIDEQRRAIEDVVETRQENASTNVETEQGYKGKKTRLEKVESKLESLEEKEDDLEDAIEDHEDEIESLDERREELLANKEDLLEKDQRLEEEIGNLETELETKTQHLLDEMRKPSKLSASFNDDLQKLVDNMDIMKLPKSTSEEFFRELAEGDDCICDRPIDDDISETIKENAQEYLSEDDIAVLNALKDQLRSIPDYDGFDDTFEELQEKRDSLHQKQQEKDGLEIDDPDLQEKVKELVEQRKDEVNAKKEKERELRNLRTNDKTIQNEANLDWRKNIPLCRREQDKLEKEVRRASQTVNFGKRADLLEEIFEAFTDRSLDALKDRQIEDTNDKLEQILGLSKVQVEEIDNSIVIEGRDGASEGQSLSVAYAYLATLFEDSALSVPFVIDSPAVSIDYEKREEVARIIPGLFDQLLIFVISPERERFVDELDSDDIQYYTVHKTETPGEIEKHTDEEFFMEFQSEEEREEAEPQEVA